MFIHRPRYSDEVHQVGIEAFKKTVTSELEDRIQAKRRIMDQLKLVIAPETALIKENPASRTALRALEPLVTQERLKFKENMTSLQLEGFRTLSLTTRGGLSVSVPPYDVQWTSGPLDEADKNAGTFTATSIDSLGYQAAGVGLFVSTTFEENVRFSADAMFHSKWTDLVVEGAATTEGGVGVLVYEGGNVVARKDAPLWYDFQQGHAIGGKSGDDLTYLTQTIAGQTYFHMLPGRQYLVWIWAWTTADILGNDLAIGVIQASVPFVVLAQNT
jgi:hypothetical protein